MRTILIILLIGAVPDFCRFALPVMAQAKQTAGESDLRVTIRIDAAAKKGELRPMWRFFGADEPSFAYMKDGKTLLSEIGQISNKTAYFRTHNLLNTGNGTAALKWGSTNIYTEDQQGRPVYDWTIVDRIFDTYLQRGVRPYAQIGLCHKRFPLSLIPISTIGHQLRSMTRFLPVGPIHQRIMPGGPNWFISGRNTASRSMVAPRLNAGTGRFGTNRISVTGEVPRRNFKSCTTWRLLR